MKGITGPYTALFIWLAVSILAGIVITNAVKKIPFFGNFF